MRGVPSFFKRLPSASRGAFEPGFGPRFFGVVVFFEVEVFVVVLDGAFVVLLVDPAGRPLRFAATLAAVAVFAIGSNVFTGVGSCSGLGSEPLPITDSVFDFVDCVTDLAFA